MAALVLALAVSVCTAGTVTVRTHAVVTGNVVRLSDIATLSGPEAERLADVVVVADVRTQVGPGSMIRLDVARIRGAMEEGGARLGRVALQGSACEVRLGGATGEDQGRTGRGGASGEAKAPSATGGNIRSAVEEMLARLYGVDEEDLRASYDARDWGFLGEEVGGRRVETQPGGRASGTKQPVRVWVYDGDRVALEGQVTASVEIRKRVVVMTREVRRGGLIGEGDVRVEEMWVEGASAGSASGVDEVIGREARTRLSMGGVVRTGDVEAAQVIRRGDLVVVHCVSGGVVVKAPARALADAREGEPVELKLDGSHRSFVARANGKGRAVMEIGGVLSVGEMKEAR